MTLVKICGIKTLEEVSLLNKYKPDFAGFIFSESKRKVDIDKAYSLTGSLSDKIKRVGVFVNEPVSFVINVSIACNLDVIQLHGEEHAPYIKELKRQLGEDLTIWKAVRVKDNALSNNFNMADVDTVLLDTYSKNAHGGTGEAFDWSLAVDFAKKSKIVLAGGLNTLNVSSAIDILSPYCVDVSSGVEIAGYKDEILVRDFITKAKGDVKV